MALPGPPGYVPTGSLVWYFGTTPPLGYLVCDGSVVSKNDYPALFQVLGTTFGPADPDNFTLPNLMGQFVRGWNSGVSGPDAGRPFGSSQWQSTAAPATSVNITMTTAVAGQHQHVLQVPSIGYVAAYGSQIEAVAIPGTQQTSSERRSNGTINMRDPENQSNPTSSPVQPTGAHNHGIDGPAVMTGGDPETRPVNVALLPCVKF